jgi:hypothetical protein
MRKLNWLLFLVTVLVYFEATSFSKDKSRSKSIDFEGDVVEGMNKRPLDSLSQISESDRRKKRPHLYHKRTHFRPENTQKLRELRYSP